MEFCNQAGGSSAHLEQRLPLFHKQFDFRTEQDGFFGGDGGVHVGAFVQNVFSILLPAGMLCQIGLPVAEGSARDESQLQ